MDSNGSNSNHVDGDVRLPPRKRLLAGRKKQSCAESTSQCSPENDLNPSPNPSVGPSVLTEFDVRLSSLLKSYKNGSKMSPEEIAAAAKLAAFNAAKVAEAARAIAEEKAAIASKAVAAAKAALDLVVFPPNETSSRDNYHKRNKLKKQLPVQLLYNNYEPIENCGEDEELARKLHRTINSSPRISKHSPGSDSKNRKRKIAISDGTSLSDENMKLDPESNGHAGAEMDQVGNNDESFAVKLDKGLKSSKNDEEKKSGGFEDLGINGRKRGRIKQKKLPLNILSSKDQTPAKEESNLTNSSISRARIENSAARQLVLMSVEPCQPSVDNVSQMEVAPTWKCQDFKVSQCIKQDKLVQS